MTLEYQYDLRPGCEAGRPTEILPGVRRLVADNSSPMTFTGTATYVLGRGSVAVVDPGPRQPAHVERLLAMLDPGETVEAAFVTHRHLDHSPGAALLRSRTGAPVYAARPRPSPRGPQNPALLAVHPGGGEGIDREFSPDRILDDGDVVESARTVGGAPAWSIETVFAPGHLDDHACFACGAGGVLFTGDHVMGWSSTMVSPPEGDNADWRASAERLQARLRGGKDRVYCPGHGHPVTDPAALLDHLLQRRRMRDRQILAALARQSMDIEALTRHGYPGLRGMKAYAARRMVLAHLIDLERRGRIRIEEDDSFGVRFAPG